MLKDNVKQFLNEDFNEVELVEFLKTNVKHEDILNIVKSADGTMIGKNIIANSINGNDFVNMPESREYLRYIIKGLYEYLEV